MKHPLPILMLFAAAATTGSAGATTLIDYTFGGTDTGPAVQVIDNGQAPGSANTSTGVVTTGNATTHNLGFNSSALADITGYTGFTATFEVQSIDLGGTDVTNLLYNGLFFGVVTSPNAVGTTGTSLWVQNPRSFGYLPGSGSFADHVIAENTSNNTVGTTALTTAQPTNASLIDGFTVSITVLDDDTWQISSSGLSTELNQSGTLPNLTYADFADGVGLFASLQGRAGGQVDLGRATLTAIPEPSSLALLGLGGLLIARRRRS